MWTKLNKLFECFKFIMKFIKVSFCFIQICVYFPDHLPELPLPLLLPLLLLLQLLLLDLL